MLSEQPSFILTSKAFLMYAFTFIITALSFRRRILRFGFDGDGGGDDGGGRTKVKNTSHGKFIRWYNKTTKL